MRRIVCTILCLCLCCISAPALAKDVKIGVIDLQDVLEKSDPGQKAIDELKGEFKDVKSKLDKKKQAIDEKPRWTRRWSTGRRCETFRTSTSPTSRR